jgi:hypothetical protein
MYIQPTNRFEFPKTQKRIMSSILTAEARNSYKNMMIQGILTGEVKPETKKERETKHV